MVTANRSGAPAHVRKRVPGLDGVRALCALAVTAVHVSFTAGVMGAYADTPSNDVGAFFLAGMRPIFLGPFFVLSGMLLYRPFARWTLTGSKWPAVGPFLVKRLARLWPAYILLSLTCVFLLNYDSIDGPWYVLRPILMLQVYDYTWIPGMDPAWTVPAEMQYYLALPVFALVMHWLARGARTVRAKVRRMLIPPAALVVFSACWTYYIHRPVMGPFPQEYWWPLAVGGAFALGMWMAIMHVQVEIDPDDKPFLYRLAGKRPNLLWLGALAVYLVNCLQPFGKPGYGDYEASDTALVQYGLLLVFSYLLVMPLTVPGTKSRVIDAIVSNPVSRYLGRISYGIYLWHFAVMYFYFKSGSIFGEPPALMNVLRGQIGFVELMSAVFIGTVIISSISHFLVEQPILKAVHRWVDRKERADRQVPPQGDSGTGSGSAPGGDGVVREGVAAR
ncbi:acyltransferase family protein [Streptomyces sp. NBC_00239]|uniref:acyltransferase family protein n=1 Tax=Streptomyces sp. NBC_00239 TaxID=2903640 RepID=UPI002E2BB914|nr:acyltransferase [Streptomyces sp. NBC_00239]